MEFLVQIEINLPLDTSAERRAKLLRAEAARAAELRASGVLQRIWRVPGRQANWSLYDVGDTSELHAVIESLPLFPWIHAQVHPLATHPAETVSL